MAVMAPGAVPRDCCLQHTNFDQITLRAQNKYFNGAEHGQAELSEKSVVCTIEHTTTTSRNDITSTTPPLDPPPQRTLSFKN